MAVQRLAEFYNEQVDIIAFEAKNRRYVDPDTAVFVDPKHKTQVHVTIYAEDIHAIVKAGYKRPTAGDLAMRIPAIMAQNEDKLAVILSPDGEEIMINRHRQPEESAANVTPIAQSAPTPTTPAPQQGSSDAGNGSASLYAKMAAVMASLESIPKNGYNTYQNYRYVTDGDLYSAVRKAMAAQGLALIVRYIGHQQREQSFTNDYGKTKTQTMTFVNIEFTLACGETGARETIPWLGTTTTTHDKSIAGAITNAEKAFLKSTFIVSTDDPTEDPDSTEANAHVSEKEDAPPPQQGNGNGKKATGRKPAQQKAEPEPTPQTQIADKLKYISAGKQSYVMFNTTNRARVYSRQLLRDLGDEWKTFAENLIPGDDEQEAIELPAKLLVTAEEKHRKEDGSSYWVVTSLALADEDGKS